MIVVSSLLLTYVILSYFFIAQAFFFSPELDAEEKAAGIDFTLEQKILGLFAAPILTAMLLIEMITDFIRRKR